MKSIDAEVSGDLKRGYKAIGKGEGPAVKGRG